jgi:hypothetical protein
MNYQYSQYHSKFTTRQLYIIETTNRSKSDGTNIKQILFQRDKTITQKHSFI